MLHRTYDAVYVLSNVGDCYFECNAGISQAQHPYTRRI